MPFEVKEELQVAIADEPGALAAVLRAVAGAGVAVQAFCGYAMGDSGYVMLVPSDAAKAKAALKKAGFKKVQSNKVVVGAVKDEVGAGADLAGRAGEKGINLEYAYATGTGKGTGVAVLSAGKDTAKLAKALAAK